MTANEIRDSYLRYFESQGHLIVPSAPMVVKDDPTLMFTNAGMNQWKDIILGQRDPEPRRRADSQKCLRVSGKHNDLEEVGHDTYHHTMFEMLGNWSFGDYFKQGAIDMAWEYLVDVLKLNPADLYVTVFEGSKEEGLERDDEAAACWLRHVPADHIINGNKHDNFWEMGDTGPCGPCSEIHLDSRSPEEKAKVPGSQLVNKDNPQVIEIWNIVFMQYERKADGHLEPLGMNVIDTGMGFERLVRAIQDKQSNYDTDIFQPIIRAIAEFTGVKYGSAEDTDVAMRVCADHLRTIAFSIADGQLPGNAKAGYVIRRILRRAVRYGFTFLGFKEPFIATLVPDLVAQMGHQFPELKAQQTLVEKVVREEEASFLKTLDSGILKFENYVKKMNGNTVIDGDFAFELFDTYGFPIDLTCLMASEKNLTVDMDGFAEGLRQQKERSRAATSISAGDWVELIPQENPTVFVGYKEPSCACKIVKYRQVTAKNKTYFQIVLDKTPFYAESGGQVGDTGVLTNGTETVDIYNTTKENNLTIHHANKIPSDVTAGFTARIDEVKRQKTANNHSATHLLDHALRSVLGTHVEQKGSMVASDRLRFDFSHFAKVTDEELRQTERMVNVMIRQNLPLQEFVDVPIEEARERGAIALFGEKYGKTVRVIQFGDAVELCGGTHTSATGNIGFFKIVSEGAVAAGVRRIEAVTGEAAENLVYEDQDTIAQLKSMLNASNLMQSVQKLQDDCQMLRKKMEDIDRQMAIEFGKSLMENAEEINGVLFMSKVTDYSADMLRQVALQLREGDNHVVVLGSVKDGKPNLAVAISTNLTGKVDAPTLVRAAGKLIQGGGGGHPTLAMAGGKNPDGLTDAVSEAVRLAKEKLQ